MQPRPPRTDRSAPDFLDLRDPVNPARPLPELVVRVLPDPMRLEGYERYVHSDLAAKTPNDLSAELCRLRVAVALLDPDREPPAWVGERAGRLLAEIGRRGGRRSAARR